MFRDFEDNKAHNVNKRKIGKFSFSAPQTRKSLVKGERFIRYVWRA